MDGRDTLHDSRTTDGLKDSLVYRYAVNRLDPGRLYLKLLHSPHWPQHSIRFSYVYMGVFIVVPVTFLY